MCFRPLFTWVLPCLPVGWLPPLLTHSNGFLGPLDDLIGFIIGLLKKLSEKNAGPSGLQPADIITIMQELFEGNGLKSFLPPSLKDTLATTVLPAILKVTEAMSKPGSTSGTAATIIDLASALFDALLSGAELDATATKVSVSLRTLWGGRREVVCTRGRAWGADDVCVRRWG